MVGFCFVEACGAKKFGISLNKFFLFCFWIARSGNNLEHFSSINKLFVSLRSQDLENQFVSGKNDPV